MKKWISILLTAVMLMTYMPTAVFAKTTEPTAPVQTQALTLTLSRYANGNARLSWNAVDGAVGYTIYRATKKSGTYQKIKSLAKTAYTDKKLKKSKKYYYHVVAYNAQGTEIARSDTKKLVRADKFSKALVNQTKLKPLITGHVDVDKKAKAILKKIIKPSMSNYQKLKAIYNYCTTTFSYSRSPKYYITSSSYSDKLYKNSVAVDLYYLDRAMTAFKTKKGACTAYSGAFVVLCNLAGFSAYIDEGDIHSSGGGYIGHTWTRVKFGDVYYIFDPQVEQNNMGTSIPYTYFAQDPSVDRYRKDGSTLKRSIKLRTAAEKRFKGGRKAKSIPR